MGWQINLVKNTLTIPEAAVADLKKLKAYELPWIQDEDWEILDEDGHLQFESDHMEHMDYMWDEGLWKVLKKYKVNGEVVFNSFEGDNRGSAWGYRFKDGTLTHLEGKASTMRMKPVAA